MKTKPLKLFKFFYYAAIPTSPKHANQTRGKLLATFCFCEATVRAFAGGVTALGWVGGG